MENDNIEIEIRFSLDEKTFSELEEKLKKTAKFVKKSHQKDDYFTPAHRNFIDSSSPFEWLRIRIKDDKAMLNYKHWYYPDGVDSGTHCDEFKTQVENPEQLNKIFSALNFKKLVTVEKDREIYVYNNQFEISLDLVENLGYFIEIESKKDFGGIEATREKLFDFAKSLGIDTSNMDKKGYAFLMAKKKGLIK